MFSIRTYATHARAHACSDVDSTKFNHIALRGFRLVEIGDLVQGGRVCRAPVCTRRSPPWLISSSVQPSVTGDW